MIAPSPSSLEVEARAVFFAIVRGPGKVAGAIAGRADDLARVRAAARRTVATRKRNARKRARGPVNVEALLFERFCGERFVELVQINERAAFEMLLQSAGGAGEKVK